MARRVAFTLLLVITACAGVQTGSTSTASSSKRVGDFGLLDLKGQRVRLSDFEGKVVMLSFWASWCEPCQLELPQLATLWNRYRQKGFDLLSVNVDPPENESSVRELVHRYRYAFPVLLDSASEVVNRFNPKMELPFTVLLNQQGEISTVHQGYNPGDETIIEDEIRKLVGG